MEDKIIELLERIAIALEKIAGIEYAPKTSGFAQPSPVQAPNEAPDREAPANKPAAAAEIQTQEQKLLALLNTKITVLEGQYVPDEPSIVRIALYMAKHYAQIKKILRLIPKRYDATKSLKSSFSYQRKDLTDEEFNHVNYWLGELNKLAFIKYNYSKREQSLFIKVLRNPKFSMFLTGHWLWVYTYKLLEQHLQNQPELRFAFILNREFQYNGSNGEADIWLLIGDADLFLFEVTSSENNYAEHIQKTRELGDVFNLPKERVFLVLPRVDETLELDKHHNLTVSSISSLEADFSAALQRPFDYQEIVPGPVPMSDGLSMADCITWLATDQKLFECARSEGIELSFLRNKLNDMMGKQLDQAMRAAGFAQFKDFIAHSLQGSPFCLYHIKQNLRVGLADKTPSKVYAVRYYSDTEPHSASVYLSLLKNGSPRFELPKFLDVEKVCFALAAAPPVQETLTKLSIRLWQQIGTDQITADAVRRSLLALAAIQCLEGLATGKAYEEQPVSLNPLYAEAGDMLRFLYDKLEEKILVKLGHYDTEVLLSALSSP